MDKMLYLAMIAKGVEEQTRWLRLLGLEKLVPIFKNFTEKEKIVYEYSDGENSARDLEIMAKVSRSTVLLLWKKWYALGLMVKSEKYSGGRMKRSFSIADIGLDVPRLPNQPNKQTKSKENDSNE